MLSLSHPYLHTPPSSDPDQPKIFARILFSQVPNQGSATDLPHIPRLLRLSSTKSILPPDHSQLLDYFSLHYYLNPFTDPVRWSLTASRVAPRPLVHLLGRLPNLPGKSKKSGPPDSFQF